VLVPSTMSVCLNNAPSNLCLPQVIDGVEVKQGCARSAHIKGTIGSSYRTAHHSACWKSPSTPTSAMKKRTTIFLDPQQLKQLQAVSTKTGAPVSELIRRAINDYLKKRKE